MNVNRYTIAHERVRWNIVDGQAVLIHVETLYYYSLNRTGTVIWSELLARPMSEQEIIDTVAKKFGQSPARVSDDVTAFLAHMCAEGLMQIESAA